MEAGGEVALELHDAQADKEAGCQLVLVEGFYESSHRAEAGDEVFRAGAGGAEDDGDQAGPDAAGVSWGEWCELYPAAHSRLRSTASLHRRVPKGNFGTRRKSARLRNERIDFPGGEPTPDDVRLIVSLLLSAVAGLVVSWGLFHGQASPSATATGLVASAAGSFESVEATPESGGTTAEKVQRLFALTQQRGTNTTRDNELYLAIEALTAEDFHRLLAEDETFKSFIDKMQDMAYPALQPVVGALMARWLAVDADGFATWAPRLLDNVSPAKYFRGLILEALFTRRPEEMLTLVPSRKDAKARGEIIEGALRELAVRNLPKARAWLKQCTDPADQLVAAKALRMGTVQGDPLQAIELARALENRQEAGELITAAAQSAAKMGPGVLRQLATAPMPPWMTLSLISPVGQKDPELAVDLALKSITDPTAAIFAIRSAFSSLALRDPSQAMAKLEALSGPERAAAVGVIGAEWSYRDPVAAFTWMAQLSPEERKNPNAWGSDHDSLLEAFGSWVDGGKVAARAWADALPAGELHDAVQRQLARSLAQQGDAAEAAQVLAQFGDSADPKTVADVAQAWAQRDPKAAADWAIAQSAGVAQSRAIAKVVGTWANDDPGGVAAWLAQFPAGEAKDRSIVAYLSRGSSWTAPKAERMAEFDAWFDSIDDPWQRAQAAVQGFWARRQSDPAGAGTWLRSLPNVDPDVIAMTLRNTRH